MGCTTPCAVIEALKSRSVASWIRERGWLRVELNLVVDPKQRSPALRRSRPPFPEPRRMALQAHAKPSRHQSPLTRPTLIDTSATSASSNGISLKSMAFSLSNSRLTERVLNFLQLEERATVCFV